MPHNLCVMNIRNKTLSLRASDGLTNQREEIIYFLALQTKRNSTKTRNRRDLSFEGRKIMMEGPLKWETDLYIFIRTDFEKIGLIFRNLFFF